MADLTNHVRVSCYASRVGVSYPQTIFRTFWQYPSTMKIQVQDETIEEINEALSYIVDAINHAETESRKKALLELVDDLLDEKIALGKP